MATTPIELVYKPGKTLTVDIFPRHSDTASLTGQSLTEATNDEGVYTLDIAAALSGDYRVNVYEGSVLREKLDLYIQDDTTTYDCVPWGIGSVMRGYYSNIHGVLTVIMNPSIDTIKAQTNKLTFSGSSLYSRTMSMANDVITAAVYDQTTAHPLTSADSGATAVMRTGADGDTGKTLSDQIDATSTTSGMTAAFTEIKGVTWTTTDTLEAIRDRGDAAWTTATGFSTHSAADVRTEMDANSTQLAAIVTDTGTTIPAQISGLNNLSAAQVNAEVDTALAGYDGPTKAEMDAAFTEIKGATWATTDTLEAIRDRGDAAWTTATGFSTHSAADVRAEMDSNSTQLAAIVTDTGTTLPAQISGLNNISASDVLTQATSALTTYDAPTKAEMDAAFTEIKGATWSSVTDTLEAIRDRGDAAWTTADVSGLATTVALAAVGTNVDAILTDTGTTLPAQITALNNLSAADVNAQVDIALSEYDGPTQAEMTAAFTEIKGATWSTTDTLEQIRDNVGGGGGGDATAANQTLIINAIDALNDISAADVIGYDMGNGRTVAEALAPLRNRWTLASNVYTVYDTDDATVLWTAAQVQTAGDPTSSMDPT